MSTTPTTRALPHHAPPSARGQLNGVLFVALFAAAVTRLAALPAIAGLGISPLIVGIVAGTIYGNALRDGMPESWAAGINFSARRLLRIGCSGQATPRLWAASPYSASCWTWRATPR